MADQNICQAENVFLNSARPVHVAFLQHKVPCPRVFCKRNVCFYKEDGLDHHFRIVHHFPAGDERRGQRKASNSSWRRDHKVFKKNFRSPSHAGIQSVLLYFSCKSKCQYQKYIFLVFFVLDLISLYSILDLTSGHSVCKLTL